MPHATYDKLIALLDANNASVSADRSRTGRPDRQGQGAVQRDLRGFTKDGRNSARYSAGVFAAGSAGFANGTLFSAGGAWTLASSYSLLIEFRIKNVPATMMIAATMAIR